MSEGYWEERCKDMEQRWSAVSQRLRDEGDKNEALRFANITLAEQVKELKTRLDQLLPAAELVVESWGIEGSICNLQNVLNGKDHNPESAVGDD